MQCKVAPATYKRVSQMRGLPLLILCTECTNRERLRAIPCTYKRLRGFALLDEKFMSTLSREAVKRCHEQGKAHKWTAEEAKAAWERSAQVRRKRKDHSPHGKDSKDDGKV
jgi:hypothetical protein